MLSPDPIIDPGCLQMAYTAIPIQEIFRSASQEPVGLHSSKLFSSRSRTGVESENDAVAYRI